MTHSGEARPERDASVRGVLQVGSLFPALQDQLASRYGAIVLLDDERHDDLLASVGPSVLVAVTSGRTGVSAELMDGLPNLGAIVNFGVGYDKTDAVAARQRGIQISNTPDVLTDCVADLAVGALIAVARNLVAADRFVRDGAWLRGAFPPSTKVSGKRVGILGLGQIGAAVAHRLAAFGMQVSYHSRRPVIGSPFFFVDSPIALAARSDFLVVTASGGPSSRGIVSTDVLSALGPDGYLVNVSRGDLVDEPALIDALGRGLIAGAALDVFAAEPNVPPQLAVLDNVVLLPHVGSSTRETRQSMAELVLENIDRYFDDGTLVTPVR